MLHYFVLYIEEIKYIQICNLFINVLYQNLLHLNENLILIRTLDPLFQFNDNIEFHHFNCKNKCKKCIAQLMICSIGIRTLQTQGCRIVGLDRAAGLLTAYKPVPTKVNKTVLSLSSDIFQNSHKFTIYFRLLL